MGDECDKQLNLGNFVFDEEKRFCATVFHNICRCSVFSSFFVKMAVFFFVFLRNIHSSIEILKMKILEYSYPTSQYFFVNKAFIRFFRVAGRLHCAYLAEWHKDTTEDQTIFDLKIFTFKLCLIFV